MKRGFTLTEMLIALALTAVAITIISEGVRQTLNFQRQLQSVRGERETEAVTLEAIRSRLEHLVPATRPGDGNDEAEILFNGQAQRLVFLAADPGYPSAAGVYEYTLELVGSSDDAAQDDEIVSPQLILHRRLLTDLDEFDRPSRAEIAFWELPLSQPLSFGYAAAGSTPSPGWQDTAAFPALVTLQSGDADYAALTVLLPRQRPEENEETPAQETTQ
ncbi:type II secretion system protein J [Hyphobacterium sp.]|uniref:type II secretion system protein J n=1 Tax=Hyphobacterium sp. TaxID=2004662 RepID=UPI00374A8DB9